MLTPRCSRTQTLNQPVTLSLFFYAATDGQGEIKPILKKRGDNNVQLIEIQGGLIFFLIELIRF